MSSKIKIRAMKKDLDAITEEIENLLNDTEFEVSDSYKPIYGLTDRRSFRQNEIFEIVLTVGVGILTNALYDQLKLLLNDYQNKKIIEYEEEQEDMNENLVLTE